ncbi:7-methylguanosine phosphate-specific 5'-nucleotidase [Nymphon striatum]|nr:7-methylguanosine phosphate-specific 5'-nucleotidase [Nymphon striatum]
MAAGESMIQYSLDKTKRDVVRFYYNYNKIKPMLANQRPYPVKQLQTKRDRLPVNTLLCNMMRYRRNIYYYYYHYYINESAVFAKPFISRTMAYVNRINQKDATTATSIRNSFSLKVWFEQLKFASVYFLVIIRSKFLIRLKLNTKLLYNQSPMMFNQHIMQRLIGKCIQMKNPESVLATVQKIIKDGSDKFQVIADFDATLTKFSNNGKRCQSCYGVIKNTMPESYGIESVRLFHHYYPKEIDPTLSHKEKSDLMAEWIIKVRNLISAYSLKHSDITSMVQNSNCYLRSKCKDFLESMNSHNIPVLIFSAGVGNIIEEILKQNGSMFPNMKIVSNYMLFDDDNKFAGFTDEVIHMCNKNESSIHDSAYFKSLEHRHNVILLGDTLGDLGMSEGVENMQNILKIGFLNDKVEERLSDHLDNFDIVITDDGSMEVPFDIVNYIFQSND